MTVRQLGLRGALAWALLAWSATAQTTQAPTDDTPDIFVNLDVGYNSAYRDASWVPVDVVVHNELSDLEGYIEVRTFDPSGNRQSPLYRLPVSCPKDSLKRFRLNCFLSNVDRVEAMLYEGNRPAIEVPPYLRQAPVEEGALMGVVIDDDPMNFGFLYNAAQDPRDELRFYRFSLLPNAMGLLPDFDPAYEVFNVIVLGQLDPGRMPQAQRECLLRYVENGGLLVVCTGAFAGNYRGTWVEDLLGVRLGPSETMLEPELAKAVLPENLIGRTRPDVTCDWVSLEPLNEAVETVGGERILATRNPYGKGYVVTIAVDGKSGALQESEGYRMLWREFSRHPVIENPFPFESVAAEATYLLPMLSGVTIRPARDVAIYLLLYVGIGVIANWLFWNYMKRREMAWVCLVGFSFAFTAYAVMSGAAGWSKSAELHSVEVSYLPESSGLAMRKTATGILSARTKRYSGSITDGRGVVREIDMLRYGNQNRPWQSERRPFAAVAGEEPRIENLLVGASELRLAMVESAEPLETPAAGHIHVTGDRIDVVFTPAEGWALQEPKLYFNGYFRPLARSEDSWTLNVSLDEFYRDAASQREEGLKRFQWDTTYFWGFNPTESDVVAYLSAQLFGRPNGPFNDASLRPVVFGARIDAAPAVFAPDQATVPGFTLPLVIAELPVTWEGDVTYPLTSFYGRNTWLQSAGNIGDYWGDANTNIALGNQEVIYVGISQAMRRDPDSYIEADIYWPPREGDPEIALGPRGDYFANGPFDQGGLQTLMSQFSTKPNTSEPVDAEQVPPLEALAAWLQENRVSVTGEELGNRTLMHARYRITDWRDDRFRNPTDETAILFNLVGMPGDGANNNQVGRDIDFRIAFRAVHPKNESQSGGFPQWRR